MPAGCPTVLDRTLRRYGITYRRAVQGCGHNNEDSDDKSQTAGWLSDSGPPRRTKIDLSPNLKRCLVQAGNWPIKWDPCKCSHHMVLALLEYQESDGSLQPPSRECRWCVPQRTGGIDRMNVLVTMVSTNLRSVLKNLKKIKKRTRRETHGSLVSVARWGGAR
jgi:hypothetical protein